MADKFDKKELLNWIETQPELKFIREQANRTFVSYDSSEKDLNKRISVIGKNELDINKGVLQKLWELIWVPGRQLRGTSYSDENLDKRLSATSALMSFSTIWDMVCTFPVLFYVMKGLAIFTIPAATAASLLILAMSNAAGKFAMDRNKGNKSIATFLLFIFFILSLVKTAFSGVGLELMGGSQRLKNLKAREVLSQKSLLNTTRPNTQVYEALYKNSNAECNRLAEAQGRLDLSKASQKKQWNKLQKQMYATAKGVPNTDVDYLLRNNSGQLGPCTIRTYIDNIDGVSDQKFDSSFSNLSKIEESLSPLGLLYVRSRGSYYSHFNGDGLAGEPYEMGWFNIDPSLGIQVKSDCPDNDKKCFGQPRWASGNEAIKVATVDFYEKVGRNDFKSLGSSLIGFLISIILSVTAIVLLFGTSSDRKVRASRSTILNQIRNSIFTKIRNSKG